MARRKKTSGDVIKLIITPPSDTFPWIQVWRYPYGIRGKKSKHDINDDIDALKKKSKREVALEIGESIINVSKNLSKWFK